MVLTQLEDVPYPAEDWNKSFPVMGMDGKMGVHTSLLLAEDSIFSCLQRVELEALK